MESIAGLLPLLLIVVVFYFILLRPARTQQQRVRKLQASLAPGQHVVTTSGIHAVVRSIEDTRVVVETIPPGTVLTFERQAVVRIVEDADSPAGSPAPAQPPTTEEHGPAGSAS